MENQVTIKDVLIDVNAVLNGINIPASLIESIGIPVARAINGIQVCIDAINKNEQEQAATEAASAEETGEQDA